MINCLSYLALHFAACFVFFYVIQKCAFIWYNRKLSPDAITSADLRSIYRYGLPTDLVAASYLTALPFLLIAAHTFCPKFDLGTCLHILDGLIAVVIALTAIADMALYRFWQFKIDASVFAYLQSLKGAFASVSALYVITAIALVATVATALYIAFAALISVTGTATAIVDISGWHLAVAIGAYILTAGVIFAFIRGIKHRPNTPCMTYYSTNMFFNHSALNPLYNLIYSFTVMTGSNKQFKFMDAAECDARVRELFPTQGTPQTRLLKTDRPNVLFVIWESLSARHVAALGGKAGVTPNLERLSRDGVLFTRCDAGSIRTDRALVCLLSGYLGQPNMTIIRSTTKLPGLPALPRTLKKAGYSTTLLHGGDLKIMHLNDYFIASGHDRIMGRSDFPADAPSFSWGVHDNYMYQYTTDTIKNMPKDGPWYITLLTLSSHEPYKVPYRRLDNDVDNTFAFADDAFGKMVDELKKTDAWDNLLIVVVGDHGLNNVDDVLPHHLYSHIPVVLLGGAVAKPMTIDTLMSQTDLAATLLGQMGLPHDDFTFSRDVLADTYTYPFSYHSYNNGFVFRDGSGFTDYDNTSDRAMVSPDADRELKGRMIQQALFDDIDRL